MVTGKRIIAADDEPDVLLIVKSALQGEGYEVRTATNGHEALEIAKQDPPDLFVLDVMMPGMSGFDLVKALKSNTATATIPIIMLTGISDRSKIKDALAGGVNYYIVKPFEFEELIEKVAKALSGDDF